MLQTDLDGINLISVVFAAGVILGIVIGRPFVLVVAVVAWPIVYLGVALRLWGNGFGENAGSALVILTVVSVLGTTAGLQMRRWAARLARRPA